MTTLDSLGFAALLESLPYAISVHNKERQVVFSNSACAGLTGYPPEDFESLEHEKLFHQDDAELWKALLAHILSQDTSATAHFRLQHYSGRWLWVKVAASTFVAGSEKLVALAIEDDSDAIWGNPRFAKQTI